jgi:thiosulfate reductase / polysulfide reductase chain A
MKTVFTRRGFLGTLGAATAGMAATASIPPAPRHPPGWHGTRRVTKIASICEMCFWRCGVLASVAGGRVLRIEGNPEHPLNRGMLCARGNAGVDLLNDPDRLKFPLIRTGKRGEGQFRRATWDEALDYLAGKLTALKQAHGPESVALFPHGIGSRFFATLMKRREPMPWGNRATLSGPWA